MSDGIDLEGIGDESDESSDSSLIHNIIEFCGGPDLIQLFGNTGSGKTEFVTSVAESAINDEDKDVLFIDTERNLSDNEIEDNTDYIYIPDWSDIYAYISGKTNKLSSDPFGDNTTGSNKLEDGYDVVILDSIGMPALMKYDEYSIEDNADQFKVFQMLQFVSGKLKQYAQHNDALVIATSQPGSKLGDDKGSEPFGDKSLYSFKELWRTYKDSSSEIKTQCTIKSHRSRQAGKGKILFRLHISDDGTEIDAKYDESVEEAGSEWTA